MSQKQHGYYMTANVIAVLHESAEEIAAFQSLYLKRFDPQDPVELFLVEMMFECHLNLRRVARWKAGAMESLARECYNRASEDGIMTDGGSFDYRDANPLGNDMLAGNAMIGAINSGDVLEKAIRLEQRALVNFCKAWDQLRKVRLQDPSDFVWPVAQA